MEHLDIRPPAKIHLIGICGTGMGSLAGLLQSAGFQVSGSDSHAYPPMSTKLEALGIRVMEGYSPSNLDHRPDLVVVGNVCKPDHPEAMEAQARGLSYASMARTIYELFLKTRKPLVVAGTHGKTTTTSLTAFLLHAVGQDPSFLIGGVASDFNAGYRLGTSDWFVIEGDEYDSAYFEKTPKFLSYAPHAAVITSVEHDHIDIYPQLDAYRAAFAALVDRIPATGLLAVHAGDPAAVQTAQGAACEVIRYAIDGDDLCCPPNWLAVPHNGNQFELVVDGTSAGEWNTGMVGRHNLQNTLAALALCHRVAQVPMDALRHALIGFTGVKRRQEVVGQPGGITVYDDFAHHPTAVRETLAALAPLHAKGRLIAAFEPRSATACRTFHQESYIRAFQSADFAILAPPGRDLPPEELLNTEQLARDISATGTPAKAARTIDEVLEEILARARPGDGIALMSNGGFGGLKQKLLEALDE